MCSKNYCGFCKTDTEKEDYEVSREYATQMHVCKCCNLTTAVTKDNVTYNVTIREKEVEDV